MTHSQFSHSSDRESSDIIWNQATESEVVHIDPNLYESHESIVSIWQYIYKLEEELALQKQLAKLKQQAHSDYTILTLHWKLSSSSEGISVQKWQQSVVFVLQSPDLQLYYGRTMWKHWDWFHDAQDVIEVSILYFLNDIAKIQYALCYIIIESKAVWKECSKIILKDNWIWVRFEQFLLNYIKDSQNWHLAVSKCYIKARQRLGQKTSDFVNYLVSLECDFEELLKSMHHNNFLNKMQKKLYDRIVANQQILETWETLIFFATRLEMQLPGILREPFEHRISQPQEIHSNNSRTLSEAKFKNWQQKFKSQNQEG